MICRRCMHCTALSIRVSRALPTSLASPGPSPSSPYQGYSFKSRPSRGGNVLGLPTSPQRNALVLCDSSFTWINANDTTVVRNAGLKLLDDIIKSAQQLGTYNRWIDVNHADVSQDPISSFGSANKAFLQAVSRRYDPTQEFQAAVPGGFKVFS